MAELVYCAHTGTTPITLTGATALSVLGVKAHANSGLQLKKFGLQFTGVLSSAAQVTVELCSCTAATNFTIGTANTTITPLQMNGRVIAAGFEAGRNWTSEPTVLASLWTLLVPPDKGSFEWSFLPGQEPDCDVSKGLVLRITAPVANSVVASMFVTRI